MAKVRSSPKRGIKHWHFCDKNSKKQKKNREKNAINWIKFQIGRPSKQSKRKEQTVSEAAPTTTTPSTSTRSRSKATAASKAVDIDSGLSSAEKPNRTKNSKAGSPKLSKKSKAAISKSRKSPPKKMVQMDFYYSLKKIFHWLIQLHSIHISEKIKRN